MFSLSKFAENLIELMSDNNNISTKELAAKLEISAPTITHYRLAQHSPNIKNLVLLADYFNCSTDFLLGLETENTSLKFKTCPPFSKQIVFLTKYFKHTFYSFYRAVKIPESTFFEWKNGSSVPTLDSVLKIAKYFECRVDFVLGRE